MAQGEKIYTRIVMDMTKDDIPVIEEDYFYYNGDIAYCQGEDEDDDEFTADDAKPADDDTKPKDDKDAQASNQFEEVKTILQQVANSTKSNAEAIKELREYYSNNAAAAKDNSKDTGKNEDDETPPENIELMSRKEYADYIKKNVLKEFQKELGGVKDEINTTKQETHEERLRREANELRSKQPGKGGDLDEWYEEIKHLYQRSQGTLSMEDLYHLARSKNPDKAKEVDKKHAPKEDTATKQPKPEDDTFGGMKPSSSKIEEAKKKGKISSAEAGDKAWQILFGTSDDVY